MTCQLGLNVPRYPTLPNIMKAKKKPITVMPVADLLNEAALATTASFHPPAKKGGGIVLEGAVNLVDKVVAVRKDKAAYCDITLRIKSYCSSAPSRSETAICRQLIRL